MIRFSRVLIHAEKLAGQHDRSPLRRRVYERQCRAAHLFDISLEFVGGEIEGEFRLTRNQNLGLGTSLSSDQKLPVRRMGADSRKRGKEDCESGSPED